MKTTGKCPKCGSSDVFNNQASRKYSDRSYLPTSFFGRAALITWVCLSCGFMEDYLNNPNGRSGRTIRNRWGK
ncbi:MAG TPA: hypothetical protein ENN21_00820 [Spirochaetes bacterium]|nr:hypothetical protein [Spirochaetota bacterium]